MSGSWEHGGGREARSVLNEGMRQKKYGEKFLEEFLAIRMLYGVPSLASPNGSRNMQ
jgi:hypothetical protein